MAAASLALLLLPQGCDSPQSQGVSNQAGTDNPSSLVAASEPTSSAGSAMVILGSEYKLETAVRVGAACEILTGKVNDAPKFSTIVVSGGAVVGGQPKTTSKPGSGFGQAALMADLLHHGKLSATEWRAAIDEAISLAQNPTGATQALKDNLKGRMDLTLSEFSRMFLRDFPSGTGVFGLTDKDFDKVNLALAACADVVDGAPGGSDGISVIQEAVSNTTVANYCLSRAKLLSLNSNELPSSIYVVSSHHHAYAPAKCFALEGTQSHAYYRCEIEKDGKLAESNPLDVWEFTSNRPVTPGCTDDYAGIFVGCSSSQGPAKWCGSQRYLDTATISGTVKSSAQTLEGVRVAALDSDNELIGVAWSDSSGGFKMEGLQKNKSYTLVATKDGYEQKTQSVSSSSSTIDVSLVKSAQKSVDLNGDGVVNMRDVILLATGFNTKEGDEKYQKAFDLNDDGAINMIDVRILAAKFNQIVSQ